MMKEKFYQTLYKTKILSGFRMANFVHKSNSSLSSQTFLWNIVKAEKFLWKPIISAPKDNGYGALRAKSFQELYDDIFKEIGEKMNLTPWTAPLYENDITDDSLKTAAEMFLYIMAPQQEYWVKWHKIFSGWMENSSLRRVLGLYFI